MSKERIARLTAAAAGTLRDLAVLAGIGLVTYGAWLIYQPAGFILGGVLMAALGVIRPGGKT